MPEIHSDRMASPSTAPLIASHSTPSPEPPESFIQPTEPTAVANRPRRHFLLGGGLASAAVLVPALASSTTPAQAQSTPEAVPAMRSAQPRPVQDAAAPTLPPLAVIALNRMGFGPRPGELAAFGALGATPDAALTAYVEQQLQPQLIDDSACDAIIASYGFTTLGKSQAQLWADHIKKPNVSYSERILPVVETRKATFLRAIYSKRQLTEVLADHWHNHFNIYGWDSWTAPVFVHYDRDVIRANILGNFRTMLEAVATSPAMLYYLDNQSNSGGNPNENYARELFELHGMGAENYLGVVPLIINDGVYEHPAPKDPSGKPLLYIDDDVYGATTCFTGWRIDTNTGLFTFDANAHFPYQKLVMGRLIPAAQGIKDGKDVLDILARHPMAARYICRRLCRRLLSDEPPEALVQAAADVFMAHVDAPDQLKQVTRTILLSTEFRTTWGQKIKRPLEYVVSLLRAAEGDFVPDDSFFWNYEAMGQPLFAWSPPNGYPDDKATWSSTMPMLQRWRICNSLIGWRYGGDGENKDDYRLAFTNPASVKTPNAIVDYWSERLLGLRLPDHERQAVVDFMASGRNPAFDLPESDITERLRYMIGLIFMGPSFQWR
ncbi:MAG: DUF1800 family protein [Caldilineaceae bacterium]|nr:DUF1800 family protein [Caldilineaceae bacterium]